jgi:Holliday junction resolvase RusA-like endonuclease
MNELSITIPGTPLAKKRPRFARRGKFVTTYNSQETEEGKFIMVMMSQLHGHQPIPSGTPIHVEVFFGMPFPASMSQKKRIGAEHTKKPDVDNMLKFLKDCCNGVVWHDDSQVVSVLASKAYSDKPSTQFILRWV